MIIEFLENEQWIKYEGQKLKKSVKVKFICEKCKKERKSFFRAYTGVCGFCKRKDSLIEKYGVENVFQLEDVKKKIKQTNLERYGVENVGQIEEEKLKKEKKKKQTNLDKYGFENVFKVNKIQEKIKQTNLERYGKVRAISTDKYKEKMYETNYKKYGTKTPSQNNEIKNKIKNSISLVLKERSENKKKNFISNLDFEYYNVKPLFDIKLYQGTNYNNKYSWECLYCGHVFIDNLYSGNRPLCPNCHKKNDKYISNKEKEIRDYIESIYDKKIIYNSRNIINGELDIYLPDNNIAIEFDGLYWHSDIYKDRYYHKNKTEMCEKKGIQLIHIFEDEWEYKQDIVKNRFKNMLGLNSKRIGARKTIIKEIEPRAKNEFLNKYHIQGTDKSKIKLGAFYKDELIGVMTFSRPRLFMNQKKRDGEIWELSRFATISDTYTPGLASKMLKHFEKNYKYDEIYSYADRRWSQGNLYYKLGFEFDSYTNPNYFYWKNNLVRYHRYNFRKQNLIKFENYSQEKTEKQIMDEAEWYRIWDSGNIRFTKSIK
jgi:Zn finger protein HypA/HybF involved in hydrogenase expression